MSASDAASRRDPGSFRDPAGYVFRRGGQLHRAVGAEAAQTLRQLAACGLQGRLEKRGLLVGTSFVEDPQTRAILAAENEPFEDFLRHDEISPLNYPYEWTISMLADAATATLDLQEALIDEGFSLKDATAYNVQFVGHRPVFIDVTSIERPRRLDLWPALGQFGQMFTFPLLLAANEGWDLRSYFLGNIGGLSVERVAEILGRTGRLKPSSWLDVTLPNWLTRRKIGRQLDVNEVLNREDQGDPNVQRHNLRRLRRKVGGLASGYEPRGVWADYAGTCTYDQAAEADKKEQIGRYLAEHQPGSVVDLGCNTGAYSRLAAGHGASVLAVDGDHDAVESLYRDLRGSSLRILPLVVDLASPSPGFGEMNQERAPFLGRARSDCALALALMHHLVVTANLPLDRTCRLFRAFTSDHLILEFVPGGDSMFVELLKRRVGDFEEITEQRLLDVFASEFELVHRGPIAGTERVLLFLRAKDRGATA